MTGDDERAPPEERHGHATVAPDVAVAARVMAGSASRRARAAYSLVTIRSQSFSQSP